MPVRPLPLDHIREALDKPARHPLRDWIAARTQEPVMRDRSAIALCIILGVVGMLACMSAGDHLAFWGMMP